MSDLSEAWEAAERALPEFWHIRSAILTDPYKNPTWEVVAAQAPGRKGQIEIGRGPSLPRALLNLAEFLSRRDPA